MPTTKTKSRFDERIVGRAIVAILVLFVAFIPVAIASAPGLSVWEQVWIAFGTAGVAVLFALLVLGVTLELSKRVRAALEASQEAASNKPSNRDMLSATA